MNVEVLMKDKKEVRVHESLEELSTDLADHIEQLSDASIKERGVFAVALSGGSLISFMRYKKIELYMFKVYYQMFPRVVNIIMFYCFA